MAHASGAGEADLSELAEPPIGSIPIETVAEAPPSLADVRRVLKEAEVDCEVTALPPDLGSAKRHHVYVFDDVVVKFDQTADGRRALRERCSLELLSSSDLPVPRLIATGLLDQMHWVVMSRLAGSVPEDASLAAHAPSVRLAKDMGEVTARLHNGPTPPGFGTWANGSVTLRADHERLCAGLIALAPKAGQLSPAELARFTSLLDQLRESLATAPATPVLAHRDMQPRNVLVDGAGRLCGLLDFETAGGGDPAEDFSRFGLDWSSDAFGAFCSGYAAAGRRLDRDAPARVAYHVLHWALVIFAYVGIVAPIYLEPARRAWERIETGELPRLDRLVG